MCLTLKTFNRKTSKRNTLKTLQPKSYNLKAKRPYNLTYDRNRTS